MSKKTYQFIMYTIVQIMPAQPGWETVFGRDEEDGSIERVPLVCWALVESSSTGSYCLRISEGA